MAICTIAPAAATTHSNSCLAYEYLLSKSSILYVAAGLIDNRRRAAYGLNGTEYSGVDVTPGATARGVIVGLTHKF